MSAGLQPGGDQPPAQPVSGVTILVRIAVIFFLVPMLVALAARFLF